MSKRPLTPLIKNFLVRLSFALLVIGMMACQSLQVEPIATATSTKATVPALSSAGQTATATLETVLPTQTATAAVASLTPTSQPTAPPPTPTLPAAPSPFAPEMTEELTFNLINQQGGTISSVAVRGQTAFVGAGPRLVVVDITNPTEPQTLGQSEVLPGLIRAILVKGNLVYVGAGSAIVIVDITQPQSPSLLGQLPLTQPVAHLALHEATLVAVTAAWPTNPQENGSGTIATVAISQSDQPQLLDSVELPWHINAIALADETVYASNPAEATFFAVDISLPDNLPDPVPFPIATLTYSLQAQGRTLYVGGGQNDVTAWDISVLAEPQKLWKIKAEPDADFGLGVVGGFVFAGSTIYLDTVSYHGQIIGPLSLPLPSPVTSESGDLVSSNIAIQDDQLVISHTSLYLYRLDDGESLTLQASYRMSGIFPGPTDIDLAGRNGLVVSQDRLINDQNSRLSLVQLPALSPLGNYINEKQCDLCDAALTNVGVVDDLAYVTGGDGSLRIFDINDLTQPILIAAYTAADFGSGWQRIYDLSMVAERGYAVGLASNRTLLVEFDLSDPQNVQVVSKIHWVGSAEQVAAAENSVYVYTILFTDQTTYELRHFTDIDGELTLTGSVAVASQIYDIVLDGDIVFLGTADGLIIVSTDAETGQPNIIAQVQIPGGLWELALMDEVLLATTAEFWGSGRLLALDIQDPAQPRLIGTVPLSASKAQLAATDEGIILAGNLAMGLMVFEVSHQ